MEFAPWDYKGLRVDPWVLVITSYFYVLNSLGTKTHSKPNIGLIHIIQKTFNLSGNIGYGGKSVTSL